MSYRKQDTTAAQLQDITNKALDKLMAKAGGRMKSILTATKGELSTAILTAYRHADVNKQGWTMSSLRSSGALGWLSSQVSAIMQRFYALSTAEMRRSTRGLKWQSALLHGWALDQVTPDCCKVRLPNKPMNLEAVSFVDPSSWEERWSAWCDGYGSALMSNLRMNAINKGPLSDALDEVDATRVNTPAVDLETAMSRLFDNIMYTNIIGGQNDIFNLNGDLIDVEIWKTRGDACEDCDANEGLPMDEAEGDIPLHPHCRCYPLTVPKSYADLLRTGGADDRDLADAMMTRGLVPNSMVIRDNAGNISGRMIVTFNEWLEGQPQVLVGGAR